MQDIQYACGECLTLYNVNKVILSDNGEYSFYFNKQIIISFLTKKSQDEFYNQSYKTDNPYYILTGYFRRNSMGSGRLNIISGNCVCDD